MPRIKAWLQASNYENRAAIDWRVIAITTPLGIVGGMKVQWPLSFNGFISSTSSAIASQALLLAILFLFWIFVYRQHPTHKNPNFWLFCLGLFAGACKGPIVEIIDYQFGHEELDWQMTAARMATSAFAWGVALPIFAHYASLIQSFERTRSLTLSTLVATSAENQAQKTALHSANYLDLESSNALLRAALEPIGQALALGKRRRDGEDLKLIVSTYLLDSMRRIREISHNLEATHDLFSPKMSGAKIFYNALAFNSASMKVAAAIVFVANFASPLFKSGIAQAVIQGFSSSVIFLALYSVWLRAIKPAKALRVHSIALVLLFALLHAFFQKFFYQVELTNAQQLGYLNLAVLNFLVALMAVAFAGIPRQTRIAGEKLLASLEKKIALVEQENRMLQFRLKLQARELALYVHGYIHSRLLVASLNLDKTDSEKEGNAVEAIYEELASLAQEPLKNFSNQIHEPLQLALERLKIFWSGILEVKFAASDFRDKIQPTYESVVARVIEECLVNARRHGNATKASLYLLDSGSDKLVLRVEDDGELGTNLVPGLGFKEFSEISLGKWSLNKLLTQKGTKFELEIPKYFLRKR